MLTQECVIFDECHQIKNPRCMCVVCVCFARLCASSQAHMQQPKLLFGYVQERDGVGSEWSGRETTNWADRDTHAE